MRYAILDTSRKIVNIIEVEPEFADEFNAHYLGDKRLKIGDTYPETDFPIPAEPTEMQLIGQEITALHLSNIQQGQEITELQLNQMEATANV